MLTGAALLGCAPDQTDGITRYTGPAAHIQDLIWQAIQNIEAVCPEAGHNLEELYRDGQLTWGSSQSWGNFDYGSGSILMNASYYDGSNMDELTADIFHEFGHQQGLDDYWDDATNDYYEYTDGFGRDEMHYNDYDGAWESGSCY